MSQRFFTTSPTGSLAEQYFRKWAWTDEGGWVKHYKLPFVQAETAGGLTPYAGNPIFEGSGGVGDFDRYGAAHPSAVFYDGYYYMTYTGDATNGGGNWDGGIGMARSANGKTNWERHPDHPTPIIAHGAAGKWDDDQVRQPTFTIDRFAASTHRCKIWYRGENSGGIAMGYAYAAHPWSTWTKHTIDSALGVLAPDTAGHTAIKMGTLDMLLLCDANNTRIEHYTSYDGITWTKGNVIFTPGGTLAYFTVFWNLGVWYLIYTYFGATHWDLMMATASKTGMASGCFGVYEQNPIYRGTENWELAGGSGGSRIHSPGIVMVGDDFRIYYCGEQDGTNRKIGLATIP